VVGQSDIEFYRNDLRIFSNIRDEFRTDFGAMVLEFHAGWQKGLGHLLAAHLRDLELQLIVGFVE
jgi:hypothetical protein